MRTAPARTLLPGDEVWFEDEDGRDCASEFLVLYSDATGWHVDLLDGGTLDVASSSAELSVPDTMERKPHLVHQGDVVRHYGDDGRLRDSLVIDNPARSDAAGTAYEVLLEDGETLFVGLDDTVEVVR